MLKLTLASIYDTRGFGIVASLLIGIFGWRSCEVFFDQTSLHGFQMASSSKPHPHQGAASELMNLMLIKLQEET